MKQNLLNLVLVLASLTVSRAGAGGPVSPEVHADRTITFRIAAPKASEVTITADWLANPQRLTNSGNGNWSVMLGPIAPSTYIYSFNVDGVATTDPVNPRIKLRARGSASLIEVLGETPGIQEVRDVPHGAVEVNWPKSTVLGETRRVLIYTPPGYSKETARRYPVLFLLHGSNDTSDGWTSVGNVHFIADNLIAEKKMVPMVIVMPNFYSVPSGAGANNNTFYKYLLDEVLPMVETKYRIAPGRENHAVAGMSMGANQAFDLFFGHFDLFSSVGALSPSAYGQLETGHAAFFADVKATNAKIGVLWIGCGRQDPSHFNGAQRAAQVLETQKVTHIWHPTEGVHNYASWRDYLVEFMPLLFQPAAAAAPPAPR